MAFSRRDLCRAGAVGAVALGTGFGLSTCGGAGTAQASKKYRKIAVEEGFSIPRLGQAFKDWLTTPEGMESGYANMQGFYKELTPKWAQRSLDLGEGRIAAMDAAGIDMQVISLSSGGIQLQEGVLATELAAATNEALSRAIAAHPDRFAGLAAIAPQRPDDATAELHRAVTELGLKGAIINSNVQGEYLDAEKFRPIFAMAQDLDVPIYLHPATLPGKALDPYLDYALVGPMAGFQAETSLHALRLIMSGLFDIFPRLQIVLGHLGEGIPFFLDRIDRAASNTQNTRMPKLAEMPSAYFRKNFTITTSGMNSPKPVEFCIDVLGADKVMFAVDYPYEEMMPDAAALDDLGLPQPDMQALFSANAERVFKLG